CGSLQVSSFLDSCMCLFFFFSSRRRHTRCYRDWSSDVCSSDLDGALFHCAALVHSRDRDDGDRKLSSHLMSRPSPPAAHCSTARSEERRVGKEGRCRWRGGDWKKKRRGEAHGKSNTRGDEQPRM